jgi:two-component sensor histidine kinase
MVTREPLMSKRVFISYGRPDVEWRSAIKKALRSSKLLLVFLTLALARHERATNAVKYGAMADPVGRLHIGWHVTEGEGGTNQRLNIDWRESRVSIPDPNSALQSSGYGRELIERAFPYQFNVRTHCEIGPTGVHCVIDVPISGTFRAK